MSRHAHVRYVGPGAELLLELRKQLEVRLEEWRGTSRSPACRVRSELLEGTPYRVVLGLGERVGRRLIVIGTHGHTGFAHALLGSVTERVVACSTCPVLTIARRN